MKNIRNFLFTGVLTLMVLATLSCRKDKYNLSEINDTNWEPSIAIPLMNSDLTVYNVLQKVDASNVFADQNGFISLIYEGQMDITNFDSIVSIGNQNLPGGSYALPLVFSGGSASGSLPSVPLTFDMSPNTIKLYTMVMKGGSFVVDVTNNYQHDCAVTITIPEITNTLGNPFSQVVNVSASTTAPTTSFDFTGWTLAPTPTNQYSVNMSFAFTQGGSGVNTGDISVASQMSNLAYSLITADFGQRPYQIPNAQDVLLKIFQNSLGGTFKVADPKVSLYVSNSLGIPLQFDLNNKLVVNSIVNNTTNPLNFPNAADGIFYIGAPASPGTGTKDTIVVYDSTRISNINTLTTSTPKYLSYDMNNGVNTPVEINPNGSPVLPAVNFIEDTSALRIRAEVELPMNGYAYDFLISDTVAFSGLQFDQGTELKGALFKTIVDNGFPIDIYFQLYFMDSNYVVIDSLYNDFTEQPLMASGITQNGVVTSSVETIKEANYDQIRAYALADARYIKLKALGNTDGSTNQLTSNNGTSSAGNNVKLYDYYNVNVRLSVKLDLSIQP